MLIELFDRALLLAEGVLIVKAYYLVTQFCPCLEFSRQDVFLELVGSQVDSVLPPLLLHQKLALGHQSFFFLQDLVLRRHVVRKRVKQFLLYLHGDLLLDRRRSLVEVGGDLVDHFVVNFSQELVLVHVQTPPSPGLDFGLSGNLHVVAFGNSVWFRSAESVDFRVGLRHSLLLR